MSHTVELEDSISSSPSPFQVPSLVVLWSVPEIESHQNPAKTNAYTTTYNWFFTLGGTRCGGGSVGGDNSDGGSGGGDGVEILTSGVPYFF